MLFCFAGSAGFEISVIEEIKWNLGGGGDDDDVLEFIWKWCFFLPLQLSFDFIVMDIEKERTRMVVGSTP